MSRHCECLLIYSDQRKGILFLLTQKKSSMCITYMISQLLYIKVYTVEIFYFLGSRQIFSIGAYFTQVACTKVRKRSTHYIQTGSIEARQKAHCSRGRTKLVAILSRCSSCQIRIAERRFASRLGRRLAQRYTHIHIHTHTHTQRYPYSVTCCVYIARA